MKNKKKILSLVLVAALVVSVCLMGGILNASAAATVIDEGNLLLNGSFEQTYDANLGFTNLEIKNGQANYVGVDAWRYCSHWWVDSGVTYTEKKIYATHFTDAHSGSFALKFTNSGTGETSEGSVTIYPNKVVGEDATAFATGNYRFSVWVKGTNTASSIVYTNAAGTKNTVNISDVKADEWTQVVIENIAGFRTVNRTPTNSNVHETVLDLNFVINTQDTATEILFDDAKLELMPEAPVDPNLIVDGGFETNKSNAQAGVANIPISGSGQTNELLGGFAAFTWDKNALTREHTTDSRSGYALKSTGVSGNTWDYHNYFLKQSNIDTTKFEAGKYTLSIWVKGDNTNAYLAFGDQKVNVPADAATEWKQIKIENIILNSIDDLGPEGSGAGDNVARYSKIVFRVPHYVGTSVIIDDISLVKQEETGEIFKNTSFENCSSTDTEHKPGHGQVNIVADSWYNADHWRDSNTQAVVTHDIDAKTGERSLKVSMPINGAGFRIITPDINGDITALTGKYVFSFWVKGDGVKVTAQKYNTGTAKYADLQAITATNEWQKVSIVVDNIGCYVKNFNNSGGTNNKNVLGLCIYFTASKEKATYALVDDISLMPADTVADVATQITGIKQPAVGATELELPVLDTNNDAITVSIAASSDENVIALDGTITTPKMQTVVDVTLKISDGTNEVTLDPIGVLVHGELDTTTQAVIEKAIDDLDVKGETFIADAAEIDGWLEYKGSYVSKASKNLFAQKKLVFEFDIVGEDSVLDKNDIIAVREELLGENTKDYTIRDLVKTFNKVVEYNSLAQ